MRPYVTIKLGRTEFVIDSRYSNLVPIGRGAYGLVCCADDALTGRKVAIKRISRIFNDLGDARRILREIKLQRHLGSHDNIVDILDMMTGPPDTQDFHTLYIVTQLFECDLDRIISSSQRLTNEHAQYFVYQILRGVKFIHSAHMLHRDLKPCNLLLNRNCDLAICDLGKAQGVSCELESDCERVVTRWYRAPEILCESDCYGTPMDVWSVGCILGEILGRKPMFKGNSTREQLELIFHRLGTPAPEDLHGMSRGAVEYIRRMPVCKGIPLTEQFPSATPASLDLLASLLTFDQYKRITIEEALAHPYFAELHSQCSEPVSEKPFEWEQFEIDFPDDLVRPLQLLQKHMYEEMNALRADKELEALAAGPAHAPAAAVAVGGAGQVVGPRAPKHSSVGGAAPAAAPAA